MKNLTYLFAIVFGLFIFTSCEDNTVEPNNGSNVVVTVNDLAGTWDLVSLNIDGVDYSSCDDNLPNTFVLQNFEFNLSNDPNYADKLNLIPLCQAGSNEIGFQFENNIIDDLSLNDDFVYEVIEFNSEGNNKIMKLKFIGNASAVPLNSVYTLIQ